LMMITSHEIEHCSIILNYDKNEQMDK